MSISFPVQFCSDRGYPIKLLLLTSILGTSKKQATVKIPSGSAFDISTSHLERYRSAKTQTDIALHWTRGTVTDCNSFQIATQTRFPVAYIRSLLYSVTKVKR